VPRSRLKPDLKVRIRPQDGGKFGSSLHLDRIDLICLCDEFAERERAGLKRSCAKPFSACVDNSTRPILARPTGHELLVTQDAPIEVESHRVTDANATGRPVHKITNFDVRHWLPEA
jgi:hypothetical protein